MKKMSALAICTVLITSCTNKDTSLLQGHYYDVVPLNPLMKSAWGLINRAGVHHYTSSNEVEVTTYISGEPIKTAVLKYSINGKLYKLEGEEKEEYEIIKDTGNNFTLLSNNVPILELDYIK